MSVITEVVNPADDSVALKAKGVIKRIFITRIFADGHAKETEIKSGPKKGSVIKATHRYSVLLSVDGADEFIGFGEGEVKNLKYEDQFQVKQADGTYKDLAAGAEISIYPVVARTYEKDGETKTSYQGKRKDIKVLVDAPAGSAPAGNSGASAPAAAGGKASKIYGEILGLEGNVAEVQNEKGGIVNVTLSDEQKAEVQVGGRLAAFINEDGTVKTGFKAYGPVGQNSGKTKRGGYDQVGVSTGHAINVLANLKLAGFKGDLLDAGKVAHDVTTKLIKEFSDASGKDEGNSVGNAVKFAATTVSVKGKIIDATELEAEARTAFQTLSVPLREYIEGLAAQKAENAPASVPEPLNNAPKTPTAVPAPPVDYDPPMDFDEDIPF